MKHAATGEIEHALCRLRLDPGLSLDEVFDELHLVDRSAAVRIAGILEKAALDELERIEVIVEDNSFAKVSGRSTGVEDTSSHQRKGIVGDWKNHWTDSLHDQFMDRAGPLMKDLGYV